MRAAAVCALEGGGGSGGLQGQARWRALEAAAGRGGHTVRRNARGHVTVCRLLSELVSSPRHSVSHDAQSERQGHQPPSALRGGRPCFRSLVVGIPESSRQHRTHPCLPSRRPPTIGRAKSSQARFEESAHRGDLNVRVAPAPLCVVAPSSELQRYYLPGRGSQPPPSPRAAVAPWLVPAFIQPPSRPRGSSPPLSSRPSRPRGSSPRSSSRPHTPPPHAPFNAQGGRGRRQAGRRREAQGGHHLHPRQGGRPK